MPSAEIQGADILSETGQSEYGKAFLGAVSSILWTDRPPLPGWLSPCHLVSVLRLIGSPAWADSAGPEKPDIVASAKQDDHSSSRTATT